MLQNKEKSLTALFNAFAKKAVRDFPELKDKFVLYDAQNETFIGQASEEVMDREEDGRRMTSLLETPEQDIQGVLNHELGHLVVPEADFREKSGRSRNFCEGAADAFAMIRHYQANKSFGGALEATMWIRTMEFIASTDMAPLTAPVLEALEEAAQTKNLTRLSARKAAQLAHDISAQASLSDIELRHLHRVFKPAQTAFKAGGVKAALKACARIQKSYQGSMASTVKEICRIALDPQRNNKQHILATVQKKRHKGAVPQ
jgi:hypothetical protein